jgi:hypothetical protein
MILGATDQKLWMFEVFRQTLGRTGMCWSQPGGVDLMRKKKEGMRNLKKLHMLRFGYPAAAGGQPLACTGTNCFVFFEFFYFKNFFFWKV